MVDTKPKQKRQRYDVRMTETYKMRLTPRQKQLLQEVAPEASDGGMSSIWRAYILFLAKLIKEYRDGNFDEQAIQAQIEHYAYNMALDVKFHYMMENVQKELETYRDEPDSEDVPF